MNASVRESDDRGGGKDAEAQGVIRIARYSVYPRAACEHAVQTAFTRGDAAGELQLVARSPEAVGELLRIRIQDLEEGEAGETLARVVRCDKQAEGRYALTLQEVDAHRPRFARRARA